VGTAKKVAQIGAVIGTTFPYDLLERVCKIEPQWLAEQIKKLIAAGLIYKRGGSSGAVYVFKHAMVHDAAYSTILKSDRQQIHVSTARAIIDAFPAVAESQPELVAHHFTKAQLYADAVDWWLKAGKLAGTRFAGREAISHLKNGLRLLNWIAPNAGRDKLEYKLQLAIWPNLMLWCGPASKEAVVAHERLTQLMPRDEPFHRRLYVLAIDFMSHAYSGKIQAM
jgi:predicted ATPase